MKLYWPILWSLWCISLLLVLLPGHGPFGQDMLLWSFPVGASLGLCVCIFLVCDLHAKLGPRRKP
jgi:hypothetical protein